MTDLSSGPPALTPDLAGLASIAEVSLLGETWSTPAVLKDQGRTLLIAADRQGCLHAFDGRDLSLVWRRRLGGEITSSPTVADVDADGHDEILVGTHQGDLFILDADGEVKTRLQIGAAIRAVPAVADIDGDGRVEIVVASYGPMVSAVRHDGEVVWRRKLPKHVFIGGTKRGIVSSPLVFDVDQDGDLEVVLGIRSARLFCLEGRTGKVKWFVKLGYDPDSSPSFGFAAGRPLVVFGGGEHTGGAGDNALIAIDGRTGARVWTAGAGGGVDSSPTILRTHGGRDIVVACVLGASGCIAVDLATGVPIWRYDFGPTDCCDHSRGQCRRASDAPYFTEFAVCRSYTTPVALDTPAGPAVVVGSNNGLLAVLDLETGAPCYEQATGGMIRGSAALADLDGDGLNELIIPSGSRLRIYRTNDRGEGVSMFKRRPDHLGSDLNFEPPLAPVRRPAPRIMPARLVWHFWVLDIWRHLLLKLDEKLLRKLGLTLFEHGY